LPNDRDGLPRQRHNVRRDIVVFQTQTLLKLFHQHGRDDPKAAFQVELFRHRRAEFAGSYARQQQQP
jgi:hypothetical protein